MKKLLLILFTGLTLSGLDVKAQIPVICEAIIIKGDTFACYTFPAVSVVSKKSFKSVKAMSDFYQTKKHIYDMWPIAMNANNIFSDVQNELADKGSKRDQKKFLKEKEKQLSAEFTDKLKNLNTTEGEILMRLIARNSGQSIYDLIKQFKNPVSAVYWNTTSKLFGYNLKEEYDSSDDKDFEFICQELEEAQQTNYLATH